MKTVELALKASRIRQNKITKWVHTSLDHPEEAHTLIPVYENFCFVLTLFRTKTVDHIMEAKSILEKLFAFHTPEGFPTYLHDYPHVRSRQVQEKIALVAAFLLKDFKHVLGEVWVQKLIQLTEYIKKPSSLNTAEEWALYYIYLQLDQAAEQIPCSDWDFDALCFTQDQRYEGEEPEVTLLDLIMGEWCQNYALRAVKDHPCHQQASLIYPYPDAYTQIVPTIVKPSLLRQFWKDQTHTHSLIFHTTGNVSEVDSYIVNSLEEKLVVDECEMAYFLNRHPDVLIMIEGKRATTFYLEDEIEIVSGHKKFYVKFSCIEGEGRFIGQIHFANRPRQIGRSSCASFEAFDYKITIRTLERSQKCVFKINCRAG